MNSLIKYTAMAGVAVVGAVVAYKNRKKIKDDLVKPAVAKVKTSWNNLDESDRKTIIVVGSVAGATALAVGGYALGVHVERVRAEKAMKAVTKVLEFSASNTDRWRELAKSSVETGRQTRGMFPKIFRTAYRMGWRDAGGELPVEFSERAMTILNGLNRSNTHV